MRLETASSFSCLIWYKQADFVSFHHLIIYLFLVLVVEVRNRKEEGSEFLSVLLTCLLLLFSVCSFFSGYRSWSSIHSICLCHCRTGSRNPSDRSVQRQRKPRSDFFQNRRMLLRQWLTWSLPSPSISPRLLTLTKIFSFILLFSSRNRSDHHQDFSNHRSHGRQISTTQILCRLWWSSVWQDWWNHFCLHVHSSTGSDHCKPCIDGYHHVQHSDWYVFPGGFSLKLDEANLSPAH